MRFSESFKIKAVLLIPGVILVLISVLAITHSQKTDELLEWRKHTHQVLLAIKDAKILLNDLEHEEHQGKLTVFGAHLESLREMTRDNPRQQELLAEIRKDVGAKGVEEKENRMRLAGWASLLERMEAHEEELLAERGRRAEENQSKSKWILGAVDGLALLAYLFAAGSTMRSFRRKNEAEKKLLEYQQELESQVQRRTMELRKVNRRLEEQSALTQRVINSMNASLIAVDRQGRCILTNEAAKRLGLTSASLAEQLEFCSADGKKPLRREESPLFRALQGEEINSLELMTQSETPAHVLVSGGQIEVNGERGAFVVIHDITQLKTLQGQFLRAQRLESIGVLASGIAHDLNNILAPIMMGAELLRMQEQKTNPVVDTIQMSARRGAEMVKQILSFTRGLKAEKQTLSPGYLLADVGSVVRQTFSKGIELKLQVAKDLHAIRADSTQIHQVFMNLAVNARDAVGQQGVLRIEAKNVMIEGKSYVQIQFRDTGHGIPEEIKGKIFEPFFTTKEPGKGTGLGLSTVKAIIEEHEGFVELESKVGEGTTFTVNIPAVFDEQMTAKAERKELPRGRGECVLVVDDEETIRAMTQEILEAHGYHVLTAGNGAEAIATFAANQKRVDLVISDYEMPVINGKGLVHALQAIHPKVRVIGTSGSAQSSPFQGMTSAFLAKPVSSEALLVEVQKVLQEEARP